MRTFDAYWLKNRFYIEQGGDDYCDSVELNIPEFEQLRNILNALPQRLDPNCSCPCHTTPGVLHVIACCNVKPNIYQIIAECDCPQPESCYAAGECGHVHR